MTDNPRITREFSTADWRDLREAQGMAPVVDRRAESMRDSNARTITHNGVPVAVVPVEPPYREPATWPDDTSGYSDHATMLAAAPSEPGADLVELIGTLWQVLDDMGPDGLSCSPAAKAQAIATLRPWIGSDGADVVPSGMETSDD